MMRYLPFIYMLVGLSSLTHFLYAQPVTRIESDSIRLVISAASPDSNRVSLLLKLGNFYLSQTLDQEYKLDTALVAAQQAEDLSRRLAYAKGMEEAFLLKGKIYVKQQQTRAAMDLLPHLSDTTRIQLLLELGKAQLRPTYQREANREGALRFFLQAEKISKNTGNHKWHQECQRLLGTGYVLKGDWANGKAYFMHLIQVYRQSGDKAGELKIWLQMATPAFCDDCQENLTALDQALALARETGDRATEALLLLETGYKHLNDGNTELATQEALQALAIQQEVGYPALCRVYHQLAQESVYQMPSDYGYLSNAYYLLSDLSQVRGDLNQKLYYILEVVKNVEQNRMLEELDYVYYRLGNAYWELGQFDKSTVYHQQSEAISHQKGEIFIQLGLPRRMAAAMLKAGKAQQALLLWQQIIRKNLPCTYDDKMYIAQGLGACYQALKQFRRAEQLYQESVAVSQKSTLRARYIAWKGISQFYVENDMYAKADPYLKQLLAASREQIIPSHQIDVYLMRFKVDSARANYPAAIRHYQRYKALSDSVFNETKAKQIAQLSIQYETAQKEQALQLREKDIALLTQKNKVQLTLRNALVGGTILLLILLIVSYNRYRLKQRNNRQLQAQQRELKARQAEINQKNDSLQVVLTEKEWLLKEIHHRVKNNLQVITSLLNSQARYTADNAAISAIRESGHRVQAMALIHQKLYQAEGIARIEMRSYIEELVAYLQDCYVRPLPITFQLDVEPIELDVKTAVPLGLIINEAVTNAFKYAFSHECAGTVSLRMHFLGTAKYELVISDNGKGLPLGYNPSSSRSLGMALIHGLSEQLGGELTISSNAGLVICLIFAEEYQKQNHSRLDYAN